MINTNDFLAGLEKSGIHFVTGVPDSLLKQICSCITSNYSDQQHVIASNEGSAVALAIGHYLSSGQPALVYMQNSGLGNTVNPITSLADPLVYAIPMLLMVGWRGEILQDGSQLKDEPQHRKQGKITLAQLDTLEIPFQIIDDQTSDIEGLIKSLVEQAIERSGPVALVVRKGTFSSYQLELDAADPKLPGREEAIAAVLENLPEDVPVVSTTGFASREVFELRKHANSGHQRDFLTVGGMGHASQIAAGIAMNRADRQVICIDGDGAALMHSGAFAINADCPNLVHILINNGVHDSVGGQPTKGSVLNFAEIASHFGYPLTAQVSSIAELKKQLQHMLGKTGPCLIEVKCKRGARKELGRPDRTPIENKNEFMNFLKS